MDRLETKTASERNAGECGINWENIVKYARELKDEHETRIIFDMLCRMSLEYRITDSGVRDSILSVYERLRNSGASGTGMEPAGQTAVVPYYNVTDDTLPPAVANAPETVIRRSDNRFVIGRIVEMGRICRQPWHFACLLVVCDEHGILVDRTQVTGFVRALIAYGVLPYRGNSYVRKIANSIRFTLSKLPLRYMEWGNALSSYRNMCIRLAGCLDSSMPYRFEKQTPLRERAVGPILTEIVPR